MEGQIKICCYSNVGLPTMIEFVFSDIDNNGQLDFLEATDPEYKRNLRQEHHYYPFGMEFDYDWRKPYSTPSNRYRFNGKEFDPATEWDDFGARWYDPAVGRWWVTDPLANMNYECTPYNFVTNKPINKIDPNGMYDIFFDDAFSNISLWDNGFDNDWLPPGVEDNLYFDSEGFFRKEGDIWLYKAEEDGIEGVLLPEVTITNEDSFSEKSRKIISNVIGFTEVQQAYGQGFDNFGQAFVGASILMKNMASLASTFSGAGTGWKIAANAKTIVPFLYKAADVSIDAASIYYDAFKHKTNKPEALEWFSAVFSGRSLRSSLKNPTFENVSDVDDLIKFILGKIDQAYK